MKTFNLKINEWDSVFYEGKVQSVQIPLEDGLYGILANHENTISCIVPGLIKIVDDDGSTLYASVSQGMLKIEKGNVLLLVEAAEHPDDINENMVNREKRKASDALTHRLNKREYNAATIAIAKATSRLRLKNLNNYNNR